MRNRDDTGNADPVFKTIGDVRDQRGESDQQIDQRVFGHFRTDDRADGFDAFHIDITQFLLHMSHDRIRFFRRQVMRANHHIVTRFAVDIAGKLNRAGAETVVGNRLTHLRDRHGLREIQVDNRAAGEINAPVETEHRNRDDAGNDKQGRERKPNFTIAD